MPLKSMVGKIVAHHVGGRGLDVGLNCPEKFRGDFFHVLYEADVDSYREMTEAIDASPMRDILRSNIERLGDYLLLPYCVGEKASRQPFHLTANAYASSVFAPDPSFFGYYCEIPGDGGQVDVTYHDMLDVVEVADVEVRSLDELIESRAIPAGAEPDVLSMDTQGSELRIILGAEKTIRERVLCLMPEIELLPMYRGQPLVEDIFVAMRERGFVLTNYRSMYQVAPFRAPAGLRGMGIPAFGDAVFLRRVEDLEAMARSDDHYYVLTRKLAFIALNYAQIELCLMALHAGSRVRPSAPILSELQKRTYFNVLERVRRIYNGTPKLYPPPLGIPEGNRPSHLRGTDASRRGEIPHEAAAIVAPPSIISGPDGAEDAEFMDEAMLRSETVTPFEACLMEYGYEVMAEEIRRKRLAAIRHVNRLV
jgi:FkbM family methyltransferase